MATESGRRTAAECYMDCPGTSRQTINTERTPDAITLTGENFRIAFSTADGEMTELLYNGKNLIKEGLQPNFWRALTDNDVANNHLERCGIWKFAGKNAKLQSIDLKEDSNKKLATVTVNYKLEAQESTLQTIYQVRPNGAVKVSMHFVPGNKALPEMPRLGMRMILPAEYDVMTWLGRGPQETMQTARRVILSDSIPLQYGNNSIRMSVHRKPATKPMYDGLHCVIKQGKAC